MINRSTSIDDRLIDRHRLMINRWTSIDDQSIDHLRSITDLDHSTGERFGTRLGCFQNRYIETGTLVIIFIFAAQEGATLKYDQEQEMLPKPGAGAGAGLARAGAGAGDATTDQEQEQTMKSNCR